MDIILQILLYIILIDLRYITIDTRLSIDVNDYSISFVFIQCHNSHDSLPSVTLAVADVLAIAVTPV